MEQDTVSPTDWNNRFEGAVAAYTTAVYWADQEPRHREAAAASFRSLAELFRAGDDQAMYVLKSAFESNDIIQRNTAARLLAGSLDREAVTYLVERLDRVEQLSLEPSILRLFGSQQFIHAKLWQILERQSLRPFEQAMLLDSLLLMPTDVGLKFIARQIAENDSAIINSICIKALARWRRRDLLLKIMNSASLLADQAHPYWLRTDRRLEAAFYLALIGDQDAIKFLEGMVAGTDSIQAAQAARWLAWLAWPGVVAPMTTLLNGTDVHVLSLALNAISVLSCAGLGAQLLQLIGRSGLSEPGLGIPPLSDEAIRVLEKISGQSLPENMIHYSAGSIPEALTESTRFRAVSFYMGAIKNLIPTRRYRYGELITLARLVEDLLSPHDGTRHAAAYNLRAITGEDYGFDPDLDLIANLPSIIAWRERATRPEPLTPGGWAFAGKPLPEPKLQ